MKYFYLILIITGIGVSSCSSTRYYQTNPDQYSQNYDQQQDQQQTITYQQFYNDLSPYGNWVDYGDYGYVWVPGVSDFRPYCSNGRWAYTDYGWTWVSDYSWGWAPFHYGRWINDYNYGWMWVPGYQWAPAWVSWRGGGNYYGWAPLGPGMEGNISVGSIPYNNWTFVPDRYITSQRINSYYVNPSRNVTIINNTTIINNYNNVYNRNSNGRNNPVYNPGPPVNQVEQSTGSRVRKYNLVAANQPQAPQISNNSIRVFRPSVNQPATTSSENARPQKVMDINEIRKTRGNAPATNNNNGNREEAPVREFPKNQAPQINKNEPPVNMPAVTPERNNVPSRTFSPQANNQPVHPNNVPQSDTRIAPATNQPANQPAIIPNRNNTPVRTFPANQRQYNRNDQRTQQPTSVQPQPQRKDQQLNPQNNRYIQPSNQPVRQFNRPQQPNPHATDNVQQRNERQVERSQIVPVPNAPAARDNSDRQEVRPPRDSKQL